MREQHVSLTSRFTDAVEYAIVAHAGQVRKGTDVPYASHLLSVAALVVEHGGDEAQATAAVLHDVVEDCGGRRRLADVRHRFGDDVGDLVEALSDAVPDDDGVKAPWWDRKKRYLEHLEHLVTQDDPAALVSLCDKLHNARAIVADATDPDGPGDAVWDRFRTGAEGTVWYYEQLAGIFASGTLPPRAIRHFADTVGELSAAARSPVPGR